jgi:hypothetical protein
MMSASEEKTTSDEVDSTKRPANASPIPVLGEGFQESRPAAVPNAAESSDDQQDASQEDPKLGKRRLFGFGRKKDEKSKGKKKVELDKSSKPIDPIGSLAERRSAAKPHANMSPIQPTYPYQSHSPPNRNLHSSSPRVVSPAGSQIFERDVQESSLPVPNSPAIPSHIQTENHIPSVLDASSEAITDKNINPDSVEIIMHSSHQPAALTVTGVGGSEAVGGLWADDLVAHPDKDDAASNYGALDGTDVRRLSFISFADVVQSEHAEHSGMRDSIHIAGLTSLSSGHRSPSPMRSPVSSQGLGTSPPTSKSASIKGFELSPQRGGKPLGSPTAGFPPLPTGGELTIETMSQALRKMGSSDLGGARSQPLSPVSTDGPADKLPK